MKIKVILVGVLAAGLVACAGETAENHPFSTLRLPATPEKWAEQRTMLEHCRAGFDEIWFSACNFESLEANERRAKWLADAAKDVRRIGYRASLEFELTIGNTDYPWSEKMPFKDWTGFTGPDGWEGIRCNCPRDPKFWNYFREQLKSYCAWKPYAIWLDDDVRVENHGQNHDGCYCARCLAAFSKAEGRDWTRPTLVAAMKKDAALAARWRTHCFAGLAEFAGAFAKAVKEFSPETKLGFQYPWADEGQLLIVEAMAKAAGGKIEMRPGSCHYDDRDPYGLIGKTYRMQRQLKTLLKRPDLYARLCPEIETYPRTFTMRTPRSLAFEALAHLSLGLDSLTWYIAGGAEPCALYERTTMRAPMRNLPLYREYVRRNKGTLAIGFDAPAYPLGQWSPNVDARIATSGIPYNFGPGVSLGTALWNSGDFRALDAATLRKILAGPVIADVTSVRELVRRKLLPESAASLKTEELSDSSVSHPKALDTPQGGRLAVFPSLDPYSVSSATLLDYTRLADAVCGGRLPVLPVTPVLDVFLPRVFPDGSFASVVIVNTRIDRQEPLVLRLRKFRGDTALWFGLDEAAPVELPVVRDAATGDALVTVPSLDAWSGGFLTRKVGDESACEPDFTGHPFAAQLAELHREIVSEIDGGRPLPNKTVYRTPWRRDGAMVAMVLEKTGRIGLIRDWILTLDDPFDRNNGCEEPDNIGETLYLLGCVTNHTHPAVGRIVEIAKSRLDANGVLSGTVDGANHPVYAMKWLKLGLEKCGLDAGWVKIPAVRDDFYDGLFWMDGARDPECATADFNRNYPYLSWANWHKGGRRFLPSEVPVKPGLMTWEAFASKADYGAYNKTHPEWAKNRISYPHSWHAAEMFLLLWEQKTATVGVAPANVRAASAGDAVGNAASLVVDTNRFATADVAAELQKIIDANPNRTIFLPDGTYVLERAIRTPAHPKKSVTLRLAAFAVLKAAPGWTKGEPLVRLGATHPANDIMTVGSNYSFEGGVLDGSGVADGLSIDGGRETHVRDVSIKGTRIGLRIRHGANNGSSDADVDHVNIVCNSALDSIGALVEGYDNSLTKMRICGAHTGVRLVGGGNTLRDVHPLYRMAKEIPAADYRTSVAFDDIGGGNVYDYCYSDQLATGFRIAANRRSQYDRCFVGWYSPWGGRQVGFECLGRFESRVRDFRIDFHGASVAASNRVLVVAQPGGKGVFDPPVLSGPHVE